eukprot:s110_g17.t1
MDDLKRKEEVNEQDVSVETKGTEVMSGREELKRKGGSVVKGREELPRKERASLALPARPFAATGSHSGGRKWPLPASGRKWPQVAAPSEWPQVAASGRSSQFQASGRKWPQELREARKREEQYQELLKEIEETCPGGSCAPGFGFESHLNPDPKRFEMSLDCAGKQSGHFVQSCTDRALRSPLHIESQ